VGRYEEAVAAFKRTLLFNPNYLQAHLGLAATYSLLGQGLFMGRRHDLSYRIGRFQSQSA
jgi:tetratricopeptide (TPR) repeat protein